MYDLTSKKSTFIERFKSRRRLRLHMSLILSATVGAGLLATWTMLALGLKNVMIRYPLAVVAAYLVFLLSIKLWLKLVFSFAKKSSGSLNFVNVSGSGSSGGSSGAGDFKGGGGGFGGGGASGSFEANALLAQGSSEAFSAGADTGGGVTQAAGSAVGDVVSDLDLDKGWLVMLVVGIIVAVVLGGGIYLIYEAPHILSDAAFDFILAGGLARRARRIASGDWVGSVFKATWIPLALTLLLTLLAATIMHIYFPGVTRLSELLKHL
jgi:hypothetical protein